jgi:hypothetical protein
LTGGNCFAQGCAQREKLGDDEFKELLGTISGMSCRAAKKEVACRFPESLDLPRDKIRPITAEFSEVTFVASQGLLDKLEEIRGLLVHSNPNMKFGELIDHIATDYRVRHHPEEKMKRAEERAAKKNQSEGVGESPTAPRMEAYEEKKSQSEGVSESPTAKWVEIVSESPAVPGVPTASMEKRSATAAVIRELIKRDGLQCTYVDPVTKQRCFSKHGLEKHHVHVWSKGGATTLENLSFLCINHHARVSFLEFGEKSHYSKKHTESVMEPQTAE